MSPSPSDPVADAPLLAPPPPLGSGAVEESVLLWRALAALGARDVVFAPGSRSAPLVHALQDPEAARSITPHVRIDERAAAFTALGISRHDPRHPGVVATTSGTAAAHLHAAVLEAHHAGIPLIVLTADRPAELRGVGANQTINQVGLYGDAVRFQADLPAPTAERATPTELRLLASTVARAIAAATGEDPGPVHLNLGFRDPLVPATPSADAHDPDSATHSGARIVLTERRAPAPGPPVSVPITTRTVVVAGDGAGDAARALAERHHLPLLAEPASGARAGTSTIPGYPALLREILAAPDHPLRPDRVIVHGRPTLSRPVVSGLLAAEDIDVVVVSPNPRWSDAARRARLVVPALVGAAHPTKDDARRSYLTAWQEAAGTPTAAADATDWQVQAALATWEASGPEDVLVLAASALIRDLEQHAGTAVARVISNRGVAGIDGTIATAGGLALARQRAANAGRVRVLLGDLAALHDLTGLVVGGTETAPDLDIIVVDDNGGRIFGGLEHAVAPAEVLRRFFTTPHDIDLAAAANALGVPARTLTAAELPAALAESTTGRRLLLVCSEPATRDRGASIQ
ncbi:MAG: 2-succinyl-5-enolpyruvyl-6-hydroxy-3-cyclohexene-1-carboxylic-acid synthase [Brachybacterium sp.]|nr:2-succinyl-5-enolpyruvyl-6-hydroxy-3-cyclohexene-1-carboxylic-acid synthase [Brachybacterium sp.]